MSVFRTIVDYPRMRHSSIAAVVAMSCALLLGCGEEQGCPKVLETASRLIFVSTATMDGPTATLATYERESPSAPWTLLAPSEPAVVGSKGLAWGWTFQGLAKGGEPLKVEGDKRTPAGIFALGPTFGFSPSAAPGHLTLEKGKHICVDDARSPHYSRIVSREAAGQGTSGEEMASIGVYEKGIVVDYPTDREARAGSCIFVHIWQGEGQGTSGCVAAPQGKIAALQELAAAGAVAIAIVPEPARKRFGHCLPR